MALDLNIDEAKARQWTKDVNAEIISVESLLEKVANACQTFPGEDDTMMQLIEKAGTDLNNAWRGMCKGFKEATKLLDDAITRIAKGVLNVTDALDNFIKKIGK